MVRHIILWNLKEDLPDPAAVKAGIKEGLEALNGVVPGMVSLRVITEGLPTSTADVMLDSAFVDEAAFRGYAVHPAHVAVADGKIRPFIARRVCLDFED